MRAATVTVLCLTVGIMSLLAQAPTKTLDIYYIDTEGGQSTLFLSPTGESLSPAATVCGRLAFIVL